MTVAAITGATSRKPTISELEHVLERLSARGATVVRHGDRPGTEKEVAAWLRARTSLEVEAWPRGWPGMMLDGDDGAPSLFGSSKPPVEVLVALRDDPGVSSCCSAALGERWLPVEWIESVDEPRVWNRHHGRPPEPSIYVGRARDPARSSPLANPYKLDGPRDEANETEILARYKRWLWGRIRPGSPSHDRRVVAELDRITEGHSLVCSCWPSRCHAEVIVAAWRWRVRTRDSAKRSA